MWIIELTPLAPGVYNDHRADHITAPPDGWAVIPDDFVVPSTFSRLGSVEAEDVTYTREVEVEKEVTKVRNVPQYDEIDGVLVEVGVKMEEYTEMETVTEVQEYTMMTITSMTEGTLPEQTEYVPMPTMDERLASLESENAILKAQINAQSEQMDFYEDCIAEMAMIVYA